jgi:X-X-X-Leu-X-X-Gly heptad repeat protein
MVMLESVPGMSSLLSGVSRLGSGVSTLTAGVSKGSLSQYSLPILDCMNRAQSSMGTAWAHSMLDCNCHMLSSIYVTMPRSMLDREHYCRES